MCGFGIELRRDRAPDRAALERMHAALAPRGPDGEGIWVDGNAGMVHRRLAIIDLSELGAQPMRDDALGLAGGFNGCIYNHEALRVNSFHHQAVERLGEGLRAVAWAPDGTVEGIEGDDGRFVLGVQWHAETLDEVERPQARLFSALVDAARDRAGALV